MCGIGAILDPAGHADDERQALIGGLRHRGPDGEGWWSAGPAVLVHTRLAIIDVAGGAQPLVSEDGRCAVVVNGEIYNHVALRRELEACGHRFETRSDCEVVLHGYEEWGDRVVDRLNGMFAFVLWDDRRERLIAVRDPFGVKPLYWWSDGRLALASEVERALRRRSRRPGHRSGRARPRARMAVRAVSADDVRRGQQAGGRRRCWSRIERACRSWVIARRPGRPSRARPPTSSPTACANG